MANNLKILAWNCNGILQRQNEIQLFLDLGKIDICLLSETHLTTQSHIKIRGYEVHSAVHPNNNARGGSAVIIKKDIKYHLQQKLESDEIQAISVSINTRNHKVVVSAIYCPPRYNIKENAYTQFFKQLGEKFVIGGDFNAKHTDWGSRLTTTKGKELHQAIIKYNCNWHSTGKPTYWPSDLNKTPDLIDFFITRKIPVDYIQVQEGLDSTSDHSSILMIISDTIIINDKHPLLTNKYTDWKNFRNELNNSIILNTQLSSEETLEQEVEKLVKDIQHAAWKSTNTTNKKIAGKRYPMEIKSLVIEKRSTRREWQRTRDPTVKNRLNNLTQRIRREIREFKNKSINSYLRSLTYDKDSDYSLWKATKYLKKPVMHIPPIRTNNGRLAKTKEEKAERFADHLERTFQPNLTTLNQQDTLVENQTTILRQEIPLTNAKEVKQEIKSHVVLKKSPGYDLITGEILKQLPNKAIKKISDIINASFRLRYVPLSWKFAEVIMIPKPGKPPSELASYRPISLLPVMSKLFERLLLKRIKPEIEKSGAVPSHQFGFREKHSTIDQVHRITDLIEKSLEEKKICSAIFLDIAQAFDKVWLDGLIFKLEKTLPFEYCELLKSYLKRRYFRVKQEGVYSSIKEAKAGVPQGSVLGPFLFVVFTSDIPQTSNTIIATFADDTAILAVGDTVSEVTLKLQVAINNIQDWLAKWRIKVNESKSTHINFTNRSIEPLPVTLNNIPVPHANQAKYLGMNLDAKLKWKVHVKKKTEELQLKYRKMYWLIGRNSQLSIHNKLMLYKQVLKPVWIYGIQLWGCTKTSNQQIVQRFQNKVLRGIVNAPWYTRNSDLHRDLGIDTVASEIKKCAQKHQERLHHHPNIEAARLLHQEGIIRRLKRLKPFELPE